MRKFVVYDPVEHKGMRILEIRCESDGDEIRAYFHTTDIDPAIAAKTPWFYAVEEDDS